jgi:hypothetical protein
VGFLTRLQEAGKDRRQWIPWATVIVLVAFTIWIRLPRALSDPLWADEVYSARTIVASSTHEALHRIRLESSPPGWFFLGRLIHQAGADPEVMRLFSVAFSAVLTALVVIYARRMLPLSGAIVAGAIVAIAHQLVIHGREMRPYELLALMCVVLAFVLETAVALPSHRRLGVLAATVLIGSLTHYFFLFPLFTGFVWLWTLAGASGKRLRITLAMGAGLVPLLIWLPITAEQAGRVNRYFAGFSRRGLIDAYSNILLSPSVWRRAGDNWRLVVLALVLAGALALARRPAGRLVSLLAVVPMGLTAIVWILGLHVFNVRNLVIVVPFAAIAIAALPSVLPRPAALLACLAMLAGVGWIYSVDRERGRTPFDQIAATLTQFGWTGSDPILFLDKPQNQRSAIGWELPGHPQLGDGTYTGRPCGRVYVIAESHDARAWIKAHTANVVAQRNLPFYGQAANGYKRSYDLVVARLRWPDGFPEVEPPPARAVFFYSRATPVPPCLRPRPQSESRSLF